MEIITAQNKLDFLAENVIHRTREIYHYQINIDNYTLMLAMLPAGEWPEPLAMYKKAKPEDFIPALSEIDAETVSNYQQRDNLKILLATEKFQQAKSQSVLNAIVSQLPVGAEYDTLIQAAMTRLTLPLV